MKKYSGKDFQLSAYATFADECPIWSAPFGLKLLEYINYRQGMTVLDIGTGTGFPLIEIASRLDENSLVYGIDPWEEGLKRTDEKIRYYRLKNTRLISGYAESIPMDDVTVDLITSNNGLNNVRDLELSLSECSRILKPGGQFIQTFNLDRTMFEFYDELEMILSDYGMKDAIRRMHEHIREKRRPVDEVLRMLRSNKFIIKDAVHDQFNYHFASGSAMLNHHFIKLAFMESWKKLLPEDQVEEVFLQVENRLDVLAALTGGLTLSIPFVLINCSKS